MFFFDAVILNHLSKDLYYLSYKHHTFLKKNLIPGPSVKTNLYKEDYSNLFGPLHQNTFSKRHNTLQSDSKETPKGHNRMTDKDIY